jgi:flagellar biosynthesis chaperone FliJ
MNANTELAKLEQQRSRAATRIDELEAEQRQTGVTLAAAREAVAQFHRRGGGRQAERNQLEQALAEAKGAAEEPWAERTEDARRGARDAQAALSGVPILLSRTPWALPPRQTKAPR